MQEATVRRKMRISVIAERAGAAVHPVTSETLSFALEVGAHLDGGVHAFVLGKRVGDMARTLSETGGIDVTGIEAEQLALYNGETYRAALVEVLETAGPALICLPHTAFGFDLAPRLAASLQAACITAVEEVRFSNGAIRFVRAMFNGKLQAEVASDREKTVVTIMPGAWPGAHNRPCSRGRVCIMATDVFPTASRTLEIRESAEERLNLGDADVIVAAGRGIRNPGNLRLMEDLAGIFPKSGLGSSRAVCDLGWLGYKHQVGVTGQTVSPGLYIACGISGAVQHLAGMRGSRVIVAINSDPRTAIFQVADYCIVENLETFIPVLLEEFRRFSTSGSRTPPPSPR